jgi:hypothetical protein
MSLSPPVTNGMTQLMGRSGWSAKSICAETPNAVARTELYRCKCAGNLPERRQREGSSYKTSAA